MVHCRVQVHHIIESIDFQNHENPTQKKRNRNIPVIVLSTTTFNPFILYESISLYNFQSILYEFIFHSTTL